MTEKMKTKRDEIHENFKAFVNDYKDETDRAVVIIGAAKLDHLLSQILRKHLLPNTSSNDELFDGDAPLSTFSARIILCYRLGLIDSAFTRALQLLKKIRNSFAHEASKCELNSGAHADRIRELVAPVKNDERYQEFKTAFFGDAESPKSHFKTILGLLTARLMLLYQEVESREGKASIGLLPPKK